jgi:hypothetical protein
LFSFSFLISSHQEHKGTKNKRGTFALRAWLRFTKFFFAGFVTDAFCAPFDRFDKLSGLRERLHLRSKRLLALCFVLCYIFFMSITQTVEIPTSHRLVINVPREVPAGKAVLVFTPASAGREKMSEAQELELINRNAEWLNREAEDVLSFQNIDAFEEDLERLTPQELAVVLFSTTDIVSGRNDERLNSASEEERPV